MNTKYVFALILALQVSLSLCDIPQPSQELVDKYEDMKATFTKRILNAYGKLQAAAAPMVQKVGESERGQVIREYIESLQMKPEFQAAVKVATDLGHEIQPLGDKARTAILGAYERYLRPHVGHQLDGAIGHVKVYLNKYLPTE